MFSHDENSSGYQGCNEKYGDISNTVYTMPYESNPTPWNSKTTTNLNIENKIKPKNMDAWFCSFGQFRVQNIDLSNIDTSNVTSMEYTLSGLMNSGTSISFAGWDTSKVTSMKCMFYASTGVNSLNLSSLDTSNVTTMENMFGFCQSLSLINLNNWNTSKCENMCNMFQNCYALNSLDLSSFNTSKVRTMEQMFVADSSLSTINYGSNFLNTGLSGTNNRRAMFDNCPANKPSWY